MSPLRHVVGKRSGPDAIVAQRQADLLRSELEPSYGEIYSTSDHTFGGREYDAYAMASGTAIFAPCRPPNQVIVVDQVRAKVTVVGAGTPYLHVALYRYDRGRVGIYMVPGSHVTIPATVATHTVPLQGRVEIRPETELYYAAALWTGGLGLTLVTTLLSLAATSTRTIASQTALADSYSMATIPRHATVGRAPDLTYFSDRYADLF